MDGGEPVPQTAFAEIASPPTQPQPVPQTAFAEIAIAEFDRASPPTQPQPVLRKL